MSTTLQRPQRNKIARAIPKPQRSKDVWAQAIGIPALIVAILIIWDVVIRVMDIRSVILPAPLDVWHALVQGLGSGFTSPQGFYQHALVTLTEVLGGYVIGVSLGFVLALFFSQFRPLELMVKPLIVAFESVPKIAFAPLFIVWFGFGAESKIALVALITFFPVLVNGLIGFKSVEDGHQEVMQSLKASRFQTFTKLVLPGSLPYLFAGLEVSLTQAMTATIVAEFLSGTAGLGVLIVQNQQVLDTASIFAILVVLGIIGFVLVRILGLIRKRLVFWTPDARSA